MSEGQAGAFYKGSADVITTIEELGTYIAEQLDEILESGSWSRPWQDVHRSKNFVTDHEFSYMNSLLLWRSMRINHFSLPYWATSKQVIEKRRRTVYGGQRGTAILRPRQEQRHFQNPGDDHGPDESGGQPEFVTYRVHNIAQTDIECGEVDRPFFSPAALVEGLIAATGARIVWNKEHAGYDPASDTIHMPAPEQFHDGEGATATENYYATMLHELVHWTGHASRAGRHIDLDQTTESYAFEELIAEFGASQLCMQLHVSPYIREDHHVYVAGWAKRLRSRANDIATAVGLANEAAEFLIAQLGRAIIRKRGGIPSDPSEQVVRKLLEFDGLDSSIVLTALLRYRILTTSGTWPNRVIRLGRAY